jgi:hypothetical protein
MAGFATGRPKPTGVPAGMNQSGIFAGGPGSSGSGKSKSEAEKAAGTTGYNTRGAQAGRTAGGAAKTGVTGSGNPTSQWVGTGKDRRYVQIPKANTGSGGVAPPSYREQKRREARDGVNAGTSRNAPTRVNRSTATQDQGASRGTPEREQENNPPKQDDAAKQNDAPKQETSSKVSTSTSSGSSSSSSSDKPKKSAPAVPGTLNYFMKMTMKDGKKNARNRAYQMFKNYKKSGKLPSDMGSATQ